MRNDSVCMASSPEAKKQCGSFLMVLAVFGAVSAIVQILQDTSGPIIAAGIGSIIVNIIFLMLGYKIFKGVYSTSNSVVSNFVIVAGINAIILGVFTAVAAFLIGGDIISTAISAIVGIVIGLIVLFVGKKMQNGFGGFLWIILVIVILVLGLMQLAGAVSLIAAGGSVIVAVNELFMAAVYFILLYLLFDPEVRKKD